MIYMFLANGFEEVEAKGSTSLSQCAQIKPLSFLLKRFCSMIDASKTQLSILMIT